MTDNKITPAGAETASRRTIRRSTAVTEARIGAVRYWLTQNGRLYLGDDAYRTFRWNGFSRGDLDRCIDLMAERGLVRVERRDYSVAVQLVEGTDR